MSEEQIQYLSLDKVRTNLQIRRVFDPDILASMCRSFKEDGQLQPVRVRMLADGFVIVDGELRCRAAKMAGLTKIAAVIEEKELTDGEIIQRQYISNCVRSDLTPLERARAIDSFIKASDLSVSQAADRLHVSNSSITRLLALLTLPAEIQQKVASGEISASAAYSLARVDDVVLQADLAARAAEGELTRDAISSVVKRGAAVPPTGSNPATRVLAVLGQSRAITVAGPNLGTLDTLIEWVEELLVKARKARTQGLGIQTFSKMLRDQAKGS